MDETKTCPVCGEAFHIGNIHPINFESKIYCSESCTKKAARERRKNRRGIVIKVTNCKICHTPIFGTGSRGKPKTFCFACYTQRENERKTKYSLANREKISEQKKQKYRKMRDEYLEKNKDEIEKQKYMRMKKRLETKAIWIKANADKIKAYRQRYVDKRRFRARRRQEVQRQHLADDYIKHLLVQGTSLSKKHVPQSLIELKRVQLHIARKLKELKDAK